MAPDDLAGGQPCSILSSGAWAWYRNGVCVEPRTEALVERHLARGAGTRPC